MYAGMGAYEATGSPNRFPPVVENRGLGANLESVIGFRS
jgi:hypothetical protein